MVANIINFVAAALGQPASPEEASTSYVHLGSTCRSIADRTQSRLRGATPEQCIQVQACMMQVAT
jgi:hypothetical protein